MTKRKTNWASMGREGSGTSIAGPRQIAPGKTLGYYSPALHSPSTATRVGASDALALPSRMGEQLIYRDGNNAKFKASEATT